MASASDIAKELADAIGKNDEPSTVKLWLDTAYPPLNAAISSMAAGGFPVGRMIEIAGPPSAGKTAIATMAMVAAQRAGGIAAFMDHERTFSDELARKLGLDTSPGKFVFKKPRTFEESVQMAVLVGKTVREKKLIPRTAPIVVVFDSLAAMVPQSALLDSKGNEKSAEDRNMNDNTALARATSAHFPALAMHAEDYDMCAIFLNQIRMKIGVLFGDPRNTPGGEASKFYFSLRLMLSASPIKKGTEVIGQEVSCNVIKNKVSRPFLKANWRFMYQPDGSGRFDFERSMIEFLEAEGVLQKGAPGKVVWEGTQVAKETLARRIEAAGEYHKLLALMPKDYEPPVMSAGEIADLADGEDSLPDAA